MMCLKHSLIYLILIPTPTASPIFLFFFAIALFWSIKPCGYCLTLVSILFLSTSPSSPLISPPGPFALFTPYPNPSQSLVNTNLTLPDYPSTSNSPNITKTITTYADPIPNRSWFTLNSGALFSPSLQGYSHLSHLHYNLTHTPPPTHPLPPPISSMTESQKQTHDWQTFLNLPLLPTINPLLERYYTLILRILYVFKKFCDRHYCSSSAASIVQPRVDKLRTKLGQYAGYEDLVPVPQGTVGIYISERFGKNPPRQGDVWSEDPELSSEVDHSRIDNNKPKPTSHDRGTLPNGWVDLRIQSFGLILDFNWKRSEESMVWEVEDWTTALISENSREQDPIRKEETKKVKSWSGVSFLGSW